MLNVLRKQAQSTLIQGLVLVIAIVFIFWGVGSNLNNNRTAIALVNSVEISYQEFQRAYDRAVENFQQQFGGQVPAGLIKQMGLKKQVVNQLIQAELLRQGGQEMGIKVTELLTQQKINKMAAFQENGQFNLERYKTVLNQNRMTPTSFEAGITADLQTARVTDDIAAFAMVPDNAVKDWLAYTEEEIKLNYVVFNSPDFEDKVEVDEKALATWFADNRAKYRSEPEVQLKYLFFSYDDSQVEISDEVLKARYESDKDSYRQPEQRHARHILFKVAEDDADFVRADKKKKAEEVLLLARQPGSDFAALAKEYSEGPSKEQGGDLGFFTAHQMVPAFDKAVFALKTGEVSELVETRFGYHIIKLEEIRPATVRSFKQVKDNLAATMKKQQARGVTFKRATETYEAIMRAGSLDKYAEEGKEKVVATDYFTRSKVPEGIMQDPKFIDAAFKLKKGELSSIVELNAGYAVVFVNDIKEPALPELDAVRDRATADYKKEKAFDLARQAATELLTASREKNGLGKAVTAEQQVQTTDFLKRSNPGGQDSLPPQVLQDGFKLPWKDKLAESPVQVADSYYVYEISERRAGSPDRDAEQLEEVRKQLLTSVRSQLLNAWLGNVQAKAKIWINEPLLE
jgi:peptidyl-prolyl cis-trans isomerase D